MSQLATAVSIFPPLRRSDVLDCQFSSWYPTFEKHTIRAKIIRPLQQEFQKYLEADGISLPEEAGNKASATLSDGDDEDNDDNGDDDGAPHQKFSFPEVTAGINAAIKSYSAVFPKLNWTSPRDASWMLTPSTPLKCTSPADVYLFLKSSDFVAHDLGEETVFEGCVDNDEEQAPSYQLELVLKKWYMMETSRELRCFVRDDVLIAISQRDTTFYEFLNEPAAHSKIQGSVMSFWNEIIRPWRTGSSSYVVDILLTRDFERAHIIDFNPFAPRTDALLFTYEELSDIYASSLTSSSSTEIPEFRVISSRAHPAATRNTPEHAHNMMPMEALELSAGQNLYDFQETWNEQLKQAMADDSSDEEEQS
ncbi:cytoplasmic protein [Clavulina sp. PMI_390]|nr:cytoplasmic protein [Clavulina sp. PMI_390]